MIDWTQYQPDTVLYSKDKLGNRLVLQFSQDFENNMGYSLNIGCIKCFRNDFKKFIKTNSMSKDNKCGFRLKPMYEGLALSFNSKKIISSKNITDELASEFATKHPKGLDMFSAFPKDFELKAEDSERLKELKKLTREELNELADKYAIEGDKLPNKAKVIDAILKAEALKVKTLDVNPDQD